MEKDGKNCSEPAAMTDFDSQFLGVKMGVLISTRNVAVWFFLSGIENTSASKYKTKLEFGTA